MRRSVQLDATGTKDCPPSTSARHGVQVYGTPYGYGRPYGQSSFVRKAENAKRTERTLRPSEGAPRMPWQKESGGRPEVGWAVVAGETKQLLGRPHDRGIGRPQHRPHDHLTSVGDPVKRSELVELREAREGGYDSLHHDRGWVAAEKDKRDDAMVSGSRAQAKLDKQERADAPVGHGLTLLKTSTRDLVDILRKELGLDVAMTATEVISEARQAFKLEDIELPIAQDAQRLVGALRHGAVSYQPTGGAAAGSTSGYTVGSCSMRPLR